MSRQKKILLCTGASGETDNNDNQYIKSLTEDGFDCGSLQVLEFEFINIDKLANCLERPQSYSGLILTSPRAVTAIALANKLTQSSHDPWTKIPVYCVGQTTETLTREQIGLTNISGSHSGNAKNLANFIVNSKRENSKSPLLLPCSNIARDVIPTVLLENGIEVEKVIVYETKAKSHLKEALQEALGQHPHVLVFFSPSIVDNTLIALDHQKTILEEFKIVAIGPATQEALLNRKIVVDGVAEKPEPKALTEIILQVI
ncbi:hypothetical protein QAD02_004985 [Eretmocerus hayati]|uniref:Uncharacterized protein n=1 Tax=Eretmocerus hayati TaxID=131215 RepID=A0ACC2NS83_9HYME|nr:hypothetical protein QAD02_004985 [Eretmocerus hayati]